MNYLAQMLEKKWLEFLEEKFLSQSAKELKLIETEARSDGYMIELFKGFYLLEERNIPNSGVINAFIIAQNSEQVFRFKKEKILEGRIYELGKFAELIDSKLDLTSGSVKFSKRAGFPYEKRLKINGESLIMSFVGTSIEGSDEYQGTWNFNFEDPYVKNHEEFRMLFNSDYIPIFLIGDD